MDFATKMVRRRGRTPAVSKAVAAGAEVLVNGSAVAAAAALSNEQLLEDQYFASPKRKDCKIEDNCNEVGANATVGYDEQDSSVDHEQYNEDSNSSATSTTSGSSSSRSKSNSPTKPRSEKGYGRTIGLYINTFICLLLL